MPQPMPCFADATVTMPRTVRPSRRQMGWRVLGSALLLCAAASLQPALAQSAPYTEVHRLINANQLPEALQKAEGWLKEQPKDPQMRFLKGVIQSQQGQLEVAEQTFTLITQDYPELPEPYNNLAVLHAASKRYDLARADLEMAVQLNPGYATAHQNLGDVYAQLAVQAYSQAVKLNPENPTLRPRIKAIQGVLDTSPLVKPGALPASPSPSGW